MQHRAKASSVRVLALLLAFAASPAFGRSTRATYEMPVEDASLKPFARFRLTHVELRTRGTVRSLRYNLPPDLTAGNEVKVDLQAVDSVHFEGTFGTATCEDDTAGTTCQLRYRNLPVDTAQTAAFIGRKYDGAPDLAARLKISSLFMHEAIGVVRVEGQR